MYFRIRCERCTILMGEVEFLIGRDRDGSVRCWRWAGRIKERLKMRLIVGLMERMRLMD